MVIGCETLKAYTFSYLISYPASYLAHKAILYGTVNPWTGLSTSHSVCSLHAAVMPLRIAAVHTSLCVRLQRSSLCRWTHIHSSLTSSPPSTDNHIQQHSHMIGWPNQVLISWLVCGSTKHKHTLFLSFVPSLHSPLFSFFQRLRRPQSAAGMMDSRLISIATDSSPLTSQNSLAEATVPFTWSNMTQYSIEKPRLESIDRIRRETIWNELCCNL